MSFLCCAIATQRLDRSLPCHRCATLGISSLFHANASEAKPCRSESLRCTTFPSQITSALFSAIPSPCPSVLLSAFASHSFALPSLFIAVQCCSVALPCCALPLHSSSPHSLRKASPCRCHSAPCIAVAHLLKSRQCRCNANLCCAAQSHRTANLTQPCHCLTYQRQAVLCLRESGPSMPCPCSQAFTS